MAEALVFSVLQNIASLLAESAVSTTISKLVTAREVGDSMKKIESEFEVIQAYITQVDIRSGKDKTFETWLRQLRKVAHDVEDIIDEYVYLIGQQKSSGMTETLRKYIPCSKKNTALCNIADQLKQLEDRVQNIKSMKNLIGDSKIERGGSSDLNYAQAQNVSESPYVTDEDEIVGRGKETEQLLKWLKDEKKGRAIISICAIEGSGKTTLARSIYKNARIKRHFDRSAWVSVSSKLTADKLFKDVAKQLLKDNQDIVNKIETMDHTKLVEELGSHLEEKRYLIVLDGMWTKDALLHLLKSVVENDCGSRVVITTNPSKDVHSLADNDRKMELKPLSNEEAWALFCKKAFEKQDNYRCPELLQILAKNIVKKCDGLPLLIVAIGSLLSYKEKKKDEWESFYNQLNWQLENNPELDGATHGVLDLSFTDLPSYLKSCFLYCGLLPEKYLIDKDWIIRLWIAEGFIEERGSRLTLEEVGQRYLEELVHRNLLQVVDTDDFGRSTLFQIRDVIRERTLTRSRKEMFGITHDDPEKTESGSEVKTRRLSIHKGRNWYYT